jgi:small subunit ribosomal protein S3
LSYKKLKSKRISKEKDISNDVKKIKKIKIEIKEIRDPWSRSNLVAQWIAQQIEKRLPYRRALKQGLDKVMMSKGIKGARVQVAGRLDDNKSGN